MRFRLPRLLGLLDPASKYRKWQRKPLNPRINQPPKVEVIRMDGGASVSNRAKFFSILESPGEITPKNFSSTGGAGISVKTLKDGGYRITILEGGFFIEAEELGHAYQIIANHRLGIKINSHSFLAEFQEKCFRRIMGLGTLHPPPPIPELRSELLNESKVRGVFHGHVDFVSVIDYLEGTPKTKVDFLLRFSDKYQPLLKHLNTLPDFPNFKVARGVIFTLFDLLVHEIKAENARKGKGKRK